MIKLAFTVLPLGTNGNPISFKVLPMVSLAPMVPLVTTVGCQKCGQSFLAIIWAKVPMLESHMKKSTNA